jgi:hypothetical protein
LDRKVEEEDDEEKEKEVDVIYGLHSLTEDINPRENVMFRRVLQHSSVLCSSLQHRVFFLMKELICNT